jgi:hypothetical protein
VKALKRTMPFAERCRPIGAVGNFDLAEHSFSAA